MEEKLNTLIEKMNSLQQTANENTETLKKLETQQSETVIYNQHKSELAGIKIAALEVQNRDLLARLNKLEAYSHRDCLLFCGVKEEKSESCFDKAKSIMQSLGVPCDERTFVRIHRLGKFADGKTRPIIMKFHHGMDREKVWQARKKATSGISVRESFPVPVQRNRRVLQEIANQAFKMSHYKGKVFLRADTMVIDRKTYTVDTLDQLPQDLRKYDLSTAKHGILPFYGFTCALSNFFPCSFSIDDMHFRTAEQYFYYKKAECHRDRQAAIDVLAAQDPWAQKAVGRQIAPESDDWSDSSEAMAAMQTAVKEKFRQNAYLRDILLSTGDLLLAEGNPHDTVWGTGLAKDNNDIFTASSWKGQNKLGAILMTVREEIRHQQDNAM